MTNEVKVWDLFVRVFHWSLVGAFVVAWFSEDVQRLHVLSGYTVAGLVLSRIVWGFIGSRHARFSDFVPTAGEFIDYMKAMLRGRPPHYTGHNPAGGAMIIALLASLLFTALSGIATYGSEGKGPLVGLMSSLGKDAGGAIEEVHEFFANLTVLLVGLHVAGVIAGSLLHRENLIRAMVTGRKRNH
ncbi:MAG: cytochrome b/b6 domain-containing protein [Gammaproteobacteria bacterium]|nr:cytochrome b/b6 domain-containing protein [Gammaproteobacteria bacterium]